LPHAALGKVRVKELRKNVISLHKNIEILLLDVPLCMFTLTATAPAPGCSPARERPIAPHQPMEGMER